MYADSTTADVGHVERGCAAWCCRDTEYENSCAAWGMSIDFVDTSRDLLIFLGLQSQVKLRIRVSFTGSAGAVQDQVDFAGFPASMTNGVL